MTDIIIKCKAGSHERRPQMIARFRSDRAQHVGRDGPDEWVDVWMGVSVSTRAGIRHKSTLQFLDGDEPSDGAHAPNPRLRYRLECGMCGLVVVERGEKLWDKFNRLRDARPDRDTHAIPLHIL
jgi:hypothetical protein